ncbi:MAG: porin [Gammaproteobacteria bacterium]|nr:porin [Gammaproteobacteria bacterium]
MASALGLLLASAPFASAQAENINIYGWQNWSYEWVSNDGPANGSDRDVDRLSNNAANIGFMSHMDTGIAGLQVGFRCEQFTYWGRNNIYTDLCNRNSKISLRHEQFGEIMFGQWLLPFNEIVAQWVDPFYDAGADSHTSIMGNIGDSASNQSFEAAFYNGSFDDDFGDAYGALAFNRRQEGVIQYVWPNTSAMADQSRQGIQFRFAITEGSATDQDVNVSAANGMFSGMRGTASRNAASFNLDERIWSTGVSYQHNMGNDQIWLAAAYERHEDVSARALMEEALCDDSDDSGFRLAGRYKKDWGNGQATWVAAMYEDLEYDADNCQVGTAQNTADEFTGTATPVWADVERDAWMVSGKHTFGNGFDFRFSYMDADEWDCGNDGCTDAQEDDTDAIAYNLGLFYTMPAGTELRVTYSEVDNEDNAAYDFGINTSAISSGIVGEDVDMLAVGIVHWFD